MNIVVAFQKRQNAENIRSMLVKSGYPVAAVCTTGARSLSALDELDSGLLICGAGFPDMTYIELRSYLPEGFSMLLVAKPAVVEAREEQDLVCLAMPFQVHELLETVEMMSFEVRRLRKLRREMPRSRSEADRKLIEEAKRLLMSRNSMSEEEAHRYLQKMSMDNATGLVETAGMIVSLF